VSPSAPVLGLPRWPVEPEPVDPTGASYLVLCLGRDPRAADVAAEWAAEAERIAPTRLLSVDGIDRDRPKVDVALHAARTGVRVLVAGEQYDVLLTLALAREYGAAPTELQCFVVDAVPGHTTGHTTGLPVYCAHCRWTYRMVGAPCGETTCPGCDRHLEIHPHHSALRGSFLASDARARELA